MPFLNMKAASRLIKEAYKEGEPTGPMKCGKLGAFYWYNTLCSVAMYPFNISGEVNRKALEMLDGMNLLGDIR